MSTQIEASLDQLLGHEDFVRGLLRDLLDPQAVDDVVQGTWIEALRSPPRDMAALRSWLGTVAQNLAKKRIRTEKRRERRERAVAQSEVLPSTVATLEHLAAQRQVSLAVQQLEEPYRTTVLLRYFHDLPVREIAERTGVKQNNVRQRLFRAQAMLRGELEQEYGSDWRRAPALLAMAGTSESMVAVQSLALSTLVTQPLPLAVLSVLLLVSLSAVFWARGGGLTVPSITVPSITVPSLTVPSNGNASLNSGSNPPGSDTRHQVPIAKLDSDAAGILSRVPVLRVWTGDVVDAEGTPLAGVPIGYSTDVVEDRDVDYKLTIDGTAHFERVGETDAQGRFRLENLTAGSILRVGGAYAPLWSLSVSESKRTGLHLIAARAVGLAGIVVDAEGEPMTDVTIRPVLLDLIDLPLATDALTSVQYADAKVDARGRFELLGLPGAAMQLEFLARRHMIRVVQVGSRDLRNQEIDMMPISNTPRFVSGVVVDGHDRPLAGVRVGMGSKKTETGSDGRYEFEFEAGEFLSPAAVIYASKRGQRTAVVELKDALLRGDVRDQRVVLGGPCLSISGRLLAADGSPDAGKLVYVWDGTSTGCSDTAENLAANEGVPMLVIGGYPVWAGARSDAEGKFVITGLSDRAYRLKVYDEKSFHGFTSPPVHAGTLDYPLRWPEGYQFRFRGRILTASGAPAVGVEIAFQTDVYFVDGDGTTVGRRLGVTDAEGAFDVQGMPRFDSTVSLSGDGFVARSLKIEARLEQAGVEIRIDRLCHFRVTGVPQDKGVLGFRLLSDTRAPLKISSRRNGSGRQGDHFALDSDRTPVISTSERASILEFYGADGVVGEQAVKLKPEAVTTLQYR